MVLMLGWLDRKIWFVEPSCMDGRKWKMLRRVGLGR